MTVRIVRSLREDAWRRFVSEQPAANIFHTPEMFEVFARAEGHRPETFAAVEGHDHVLALLVPVAVTLGGGVARYLTTRAVAYGSVLHEPTEAGREAAGAVLDAYDRAADRAVVFTELRNLADLSDLQPIMRQRGYAFEPHLNYLVSLAGGADETFLRIGRRTRKQIRHGLRTGDVTIEEAATRDEALECVDVLRRTYAGARVPLADRSLFEAAFDVLHHRRMVKFVLARIDRTCVAASVELVFKDTIYGWYGGVDRAYVSHTPNELLMWYVLKWGAENGFATYDFGGAGRPDEEYGVRNFKAKFGGELVCYGRNVRTHAPARLRVSRAGYGLYRRLMSITSGAPAAAAVLAKRAASSSSRRRTTRRPSRSPASSELAEVQSVE
jgi:CelD/BcsL family acetyltransferase involved in cellulose biosynthesis